MNNLELDPFDVATIERKERIMLEELALRLGGLIVGGCLYLLDSGSVLDSINVNRITTSGNKQVSR